MLRIDRSNLLYEAKRYNQMMEEDTLHENFSSVEASVPLAVTAVTGMGEENLGTRLATDIHIQELNGMPDVEDKAAMAWFRMLNSKLDAILALLHKEHTEFSKLPYRKVEISGAGVKIYGNEDFQKGNLVEIRTLLHTAPPTALFIGGKVVECSGNAIFIKYLPMTEDVRDRIVHFVFSRQREILRKQKEE
jgi:hypothetical protein